MGSALALKVYARKMERERDVRARSYRFPVPVGKTRSSGPWWVSRETFWTKLNAVGAIALGIYLVFFRDPAWYEWMTSWMMLFPLALIALGGAVPLIARLRKTHMPTVAVWAIFATVLVALAAGRAGGDAFSYQHSNCWTISKSGDADRGGLVEIIECTPDGGKPGAVGASTASRGAVVSASS